MGASREIGLGKTEGDVGSSGEETKVDGVEATLTRDGAASINVA